MLGGAPLLAMTDAVVHARLLSCPGWVHREVRSVNLCCVAACGAKGSCRLAAALSPLLPAPGAGLALHSPQPSTYLLETRRVCFAPVKRWATSSVVAGK